MRIRGRVAIGGASQYKLGRGYSIKSGTHGIRVREPWRWYWLARRSDLEPHVANKLGYTASGSTGLGQPLSRGTVRCLFSTLQSIYDVVRAYGTYINYIIWDEGEEDVPYIR